MCISAKCFHYCVYRMCCLLFPELLPFLSLAPLPHHRQQQCKQLSSRTFELLSQSSSPSLWRSWQQDVSGALHGCKQIHRHTHTTHHQVDSQAQGDKSPFKNTTHTHKIGQSVNTLSSAWRCDKISLQIKTIWKALTLPFSPPNLGQMDLNQLNHSCMDLVKKTRTLNALKNPELCSAPTLRWWAWKWRGSEARCLFCIWNSEEGEGLEEKGEMGGGGGCCFCGMT